MEILDYYSEKSEESYFSQNDSANSLVPGAIAVFCPMASNVLSSWFSPPIENLWGSHQVSHCLLITNLLLCL